MLNLSPKIFVLKNTLLFLCLLMSSIFFVSCEDAEFEPAGGGLPAKHIILTDSTFNPEAVEITNGGGAVRFVNSTDSLHTVVSLDPTFFNIPLAPSQTFYYRPDTIVSAPLNIPYRCEQHPDVQGVITILP